MKTRIAPRRNHPLFNTDLDEPISALRAGRVGAVAELDEQGGDVGGRVGFDVERDAGDRVDEAEGLGVEGLAMEGDPGRGEEAWTIDGIADDRQSDGGQVDADLMGPAGLEPAGHERGAAAEPLEDAVVRHRVAAFVIVGHAGTAVAAVSDEGSVDPAGVEVGRALNHRQILALDGVGLEQRLQSAEGFGRAGKDQGPRGVFVEPVDDPEIGPSTVAELEVAARSFPERVALAVGRGDRE
jgi:hypothetical protein